MAGVVGTGAIATTAGTGGGFGSYMLVNAVVQTLMGYKRRNGQDAAAVENESFQEDLVRAKHEFQDELEAEKVVAMRHKMQVAREYRLIEKFESSKLKELMGELKTLLDREFPLKDESIPIIIDAIEEYRKLGYGVQVPLNVILLHTLENAGIDYDEVVTSLDNYGDKLGNIKYRRWCDKDVARNAALFNLHAILGNIPTAVISPYFWGNKVHFTAALWDAQSESKPMIRPLFSIDCDFSQLKSVEGRKAFQQKLTMISAVISGCARDSYALLVHGLKPTFPKLLQEDKSLREMLQAKENKAVLDFVLKEYQGTAQSISLIESSSRVFTEDEKMILIGQTENAIKMIEKL